MSKGASSSLPCIEAALPRRSMSLTSYEYEVESSTLTYEKARHFSELFLSHEIEIFEFNRLRVPVIITDLSSEISDADNATNSIKFKYKYTTWLFPVSFKTSANVFDNPFHRTFD